MVAVIIPFKKAATIDFRPLKIDDMTHFGLVWWLLTPGSHPTSTVPPLTPKHFAFHASIALTADHTGPLQQVLDQAVNHGRIGWGSFHGTQWHGDRLQVRSVNGE